jgi:hypothetical protein
MDIFSSHCHDCVFDVKQHLMYMSLWYLGLKSDDEPFHQYQQIKQNWGAMGFNYIFNNISVISWRTALLMEET